MTDNKEKNQDIIGYPTISRNYRLFLATLIGVCILGLISTGAMTYFYLITSPMNDGATKLPGIIMIVAAVGSGLYTAFFFYIDKSTRVIYTY